MPNKPSLQEIFSRKNEGQSRPGLDEIFSSRRGRGLIGPPEVKDTMQPADHGPEFDYSMLKPDEFNPRAVPQMVRDAAGTGLLVAGAGAKELSRHVPAALGGLALTKSPWGAAAGLLYSVMNGGKAIPSGLLNAKE